MEAAWAMVGELVVVNKRSEAESVLDLERERGLPEAANPVLDVGEVGGE